MQAFFEKSCGISRTGRRLRSGMPEPAPGMGPAVQALLFTAQKTGII